jgi:hypothetical protein
MQLSYHYLVLEDPLFHEARRQQVLLWVSWGKVTTLAMWLRELAGKDRAPFQPLERQYFDRTAGSLPRARKKFPLFPKGRTGFDKPVGKQGDVQHEKDGRAWHLFQDI